jgi:hypothetical protein
MHRRLVGPAGRSQVAGGAGFDLDTVTEADLATPARPAPAMTMTDLERVAATPASCRQGLRRRHWEHVSTPIECPASPAPSGSRPTRSTTSNTPTRWSFGRLAILPFQSYRLTPRQIYRPPRIFARCSIACRSAQICNADPSVRVMPPPAVDSWRHELDEGAQDARS